jgi:hypothetical protein
MLSHIKIYVSHSSNYDYQNELYFPLKSSGLMREYDFFFLTLLTTKTLTCGSCAIIRA